MHLLRILSNLFVLDGKYSTAIFKTSNRLYFSSSKIVQDKTNQLDINVSQNQNRMISLLKPSDNDNAKLDITYPQKGLLTGIHDIKSAEFYSENISIKSTYELLSEPNHIYNILLNNAAGNKTKLNENLKNMSEKAEEFIQSDEVWDRIELITSIENIISKKGKFVCILAGKNTGKSIVLNSIGKKFPNKVFTVDLRNHPDILKGLLYAIHERERLNMQNNVNVFSKIIKSFLSISREVTDEDFHKYLNIAMSKSYHKDLSTVLKELVNDLGAITLIIDEANISLKVSATTTNDEVKIIKQTLELFTFLTKQTNQLNVILVSSEHAFPYRLQNPKLNFNLDNLNGYLYTSEIQPKDMYNLLTMKWGVESTLAIALINIYGGNIYDMKEALSELYLKKEKMDYFFDSILSSNVIKCLKWKFENNVDQLRMQDTLQQLAITGFVMLEDIDDPVAKVISDNNVGGVVKKSAEVIGLNWKVWKQTKFKYGIVPSKQSIRLVIAEILEDYFQK